MDFRFKNAVMLSKMVMKSSFKQGDIVVDATCGNGHDSLYLSNIVGESGKLYCFDIQKEAILNTKNMLVSNNAPENYILINDGHENVDKYINSKINGAVFNLGYLPGGDHRKITKPDTTIAAIAKLLNILSPGGIIIIVIYWGHSGGDVEKEELLRFVKGIDSKKFTVIISQFLNQKNCPPMLLTIEKSY